MKDIINYILNRGFQYQWSGLDSSNGKLLAKAIYINPITGDVIDIWDDGTFEIYNQWGKNPALVVNDPLMSIGLID